MSIDNDKFQFVELNSTYILKGARLKYTLLPLIFYYVFIKRSFMHTNTYLIQRHKINEASTLRVGASFILQCILLCRQACNQVLS